MSELIADFLELPVPTTSPTYAIGKFCFFKFSRILSPSGFLNSNIANACSGISGRVVACTAGDKSSVFVSPST